MKKWPILIFLIPALFCVKAQAPEGISITRATLFDATFWTDDPDVVGAEIYVAGVYKTKIYTSLQSGTIKILEPIREPLVIRVCYPNGTDRVINFYHGKINRENATISLYAGKQKPSSKKSSGGSSSSSGSRSSENSSASTSSRAVSSSVASSASGISSEAAGVAGVVGGLVIIGAILANSESGPSDDDIYNAWEKEYEKDQVENAAINAQKIKDALSRAAPPDNIKDDSHLTPIAEPCAANDTIQ